jgi:pimeloyl-ACP methyl ester carboxylesterase
MSERRASAGRNQKPRGWRPRKPHFAIDDTISAELMPFSTQSLDGTLISCERYGTGRPLLVISGALFASERWLSVVPLLTSERQVLVLDRRGRGKSGDAPLYAPEREVEDVLSVLSVIDGPVDLLGHSSGAILALQVAARAPENLGQLIAYEPPVFFNAADSIAQDLPERLEGLLAAGHADTAVLTFLREGPRVPERDLLGLQASPFWGQMLAALAHTVPYDARIQRAFSAAPSELLEIENRTLMLIGAASPERMQLGARRVAERLPHVQVRELVGQQHMAMVTAAALFANAVSDFLGQSPA